MSDAQSRSIWRLEKAPGDVTTLWFDSPGSLAERPGR